ncbi:Carbon-nitrogen hydrolase [Pseudomonas sp. NFACC48-1]|nr:Carbon-nitrogen hydrolase [Pseudomonas sp. NFACC44-2]SDA42826.1 Carbon-nitrogen hydrolase [Pseudomonas sp. NFACC51]SFH55242.1 Carbon-nitrogen hydrolase [Pseudomonas sp. NFACC54]SFT04623.1 Carbon-nitrogen hydrolase [Pseudomonas sp. NFACC48-1]
MTAPAFAAAQSISIAGDVRANLQHSMQVAAEQGVQLLVFPELSLTGYEGGLAADLAILPENAILQPLRDLARELGLTAVVGMPIRLSADAPVLIGALVLGADGSLGVYSKQHLHPGGRSHLRPGAWRLDTGDGAGLHRPGGMRRFFPRQPFCRGSWAGRYALCGGGVDHRGWLRVRYGIAARICPAACHDRADGQSWRRHRRLGIGWSQCHLGAGRFAARGSARRGRAVGDRPPRSQRLGRTSRAGGSAWMRCP